MRCTFTAVLALLLIVPLVPAGDDDEKKDAEPKTAKVRKPLEPGNPMPGPFRAFNVTGSRAQMFHCLVCEHQLNPAVAVIARDPADEALAKLLTGLEAAVTARKADRLAAFAIFPTLKTDVTADEGRFEAIPALEKLAKDAQLGQVALALDRAASDRTAAYGIGEEDAVTVIMYSQFTVRGRRTFTAEAPLTEEAVEAILKDVAKLK